MRAPNDLPNSITGLIDLHDRFSDVIGTTRSSADARMRGRSRMHWLQILIATVIAIFLLLAIRRAWLELSRSPESLRWEDIRWGWMVPGLLWSMLALVPLGIAWLQILRDFGTEVGWRSGAYAYCLGQLGKYVPGKAMVILLRVGQLHRLGHPVRPAILSVFMETLTNFATGAVLGAMLIYSMSPPTWLFWLATLCMPIAIAALLPHPFRYLVAKISRSRIGNMPESIAHAIDGRMMLRTCIWSGLGWLCQGTALWCVMLALSPAETLWTWRAWCVCITSACLGGVAGFVAMVPGGAGIREVSVMWIMTSIVSAPAALLSAVVSRILAMLAEVLMVAVTWALDRSRPTPIPMGTPTSGRDIDIDARQD